VRNYRALIVHRSQEVIDGLVRELENLSLPTDGTTDASEAIELLQSTQYGAVVLDDELPGFGSLRVYELLDADRNRLVLMIAVSKRSLAAARRNLEADLEFVSTPETPPEIGRLALRIRGRLINTGLSKEFNDEPALTSTAPRSQREHSPATKQAQQQSVRSTSPNPWRVVIAVLFVVVAFYLMVRIINAQRANVSPVGEGSSVELVRAPPSASRPTWFEVQRSNGETAPLGYAAVGQRV